jgi:hypothetical protein
VVESNTLFNDTLHSGSFEMRFQLSLCLFALVPLPVLAQSDENSRYYITLFGGHANILRARTGHTWATYTKLQTTADGAQQIDTQAISWMPKTLVIRPFALRSEAGVNLTHQQSLEFMAAGRRPFVTSFGPYQITAEHYHEGLAQKKRLDSGAIRYHGLGLFGRRMDVMHCIDGVTRTDKIWERQASPSLANGMLGTAQAVWAMKRSGFDDHSPAEPSLRPLVTPFSPVRIHER